MNGNHGFMTDRIERRAALAVERRRRTMRARVLTLALFAAVALATGQTPAGAQAVGTATIQGRVTDESGAARDLQDARWS